MANNKSTLEKMLDRAQTDNEFEKIGIMLAFKLALKQLESGEASSQVITHFLKLGSSLTQLAIKEKEEGIELMKAKAQNLASMDEFKKIAKDAIDAMSKYKGE